MNILDDVTLIRQFVTRHPTSNTSQNFRLESALGGTQLLSQSGEFLASLDHLTQPTIVRVKPGTQPWPLLHQILSEHGFTLPDKMARSPQELLDESGFIRYEAQEIPIGYQMQCTKAKVLWNVWSAQTRPYHRFDIRLELLLFTRNAWFPIQEVSCDRDIVFIKTLITANSLQSGDYVTWLQKSTVADKSKLEARRSPNALTVIRTLIGALWTTS